MIGSSSGGNNLIIDEIHEPRVACTVMGAELFGADGFVLFAVGCVTSYAFSSHRGIYTTQRIAVPKGPTARLPAAEGGAVGDIARRTRP